MRYIFLSVAAWIWFRYQDISIRHKFVTLLLGITSLVYILFFANHDWSPLIYHGGWNSQNYPTYFWTLLFILILIRLISIIPQQLNKRLEWLGVNSWEIFLAQMFIIGFVRELLEIGGPVLTSALYVLFVLVTSIGSVVLYKLLLRRLSIV